MPSFESGLVSVIIPVYNGAVFLKQTIESVLEQTYSPIEVIAVDDGSTDNSREVLQSYNHQLILVYQSNFGVGSARNNGIERAKGEFIAFLDQDDWWLSKKIEKQVTLLQENEEIGLVHTAVDYYDHENATFASPLMPKAGEMIGNCFHKLLLGNSICNSSVMVRKNILDKIGLCDLSFHKNSVQDYDLWLRLSQHTQFGFLFDRLTVFRIHPEQGQQDRQIMLTEEIKLLLRYKTEAEWCVQSQNRKRLATLYDELAVAYFDTGNINQTRHFMVKAFKTNPSLAQALRLSISSLPAIVIIFLRYLKQSIFNF